MPRGLLVDLDDTILDDTGAVDSCWTEACLEYDFAGDRRTLIETIQRVRDWYWSDPDRHRVGRADMSRARRHIVRTALRELQHDDDHLAHRIADRYSELRDFKLCLLPDAIDTLMWIRASGCRLALVTNGAGDAQRRKIARFDLSRLFDAIVVEGELGCGKPDPRVYERSLELLDVAPSAAWMIGDNLEWDVAAPQRLGLKGVWIDRSGAGVPPSSGVRPDRIVRNLAELRPHP